MHAAILIGLLLGVDSLSLATTNDQNTVKRHKVKIRISEKGQLAPARVTIRGQDGSFYAPENTVVRTLTSGNEYFYTNGECEVTLPETPSTLLVSRGIETLTEKLVLQPRRETRIMVELTRWTNLSTDSWYSGDSHVHLHTGGDFEVSISDALTAARAEDLNYTNLNVSNNLGDDIRDAEFITGKPHPLSTDRHLLVFGEEMRSSIYGHMLLFGINKLVEPQYTGFDDTPHHYDYPPNFDQADETVKQGGVVSYGHPMFTDQPDPYVTDPLSHNGAALELPIDAIFDRAHAIDIMSYNSDEPLSAGLWYRLLNCGIRLSACVGTDALLDQSTDPLGGDRVYVKVDGVLSNQRWLDGLREGRTFVTNGPMINLQVQGRSVGETIDLKQPSTVRVKTRIDSLVPFDTVHVIMNGKAILTKQYTPSKDADRVTTQIIDVNLPIKKSSWIAIHVTGPEDPRVLDGRAWAHTSPVYIKISGQPIRHRDDAAYFVTWIDKLLNIVATRNRYPTPEDRERVETLFRKAQDLFRERQDDVD